MTDHNVAVVVVHEICKMVLLVLVLVLVLVVVLMIVTVYVIQVDKPVARCWRSLPMNNFGYSTSHPHGKKPLRPVMRAN
jgi:hypothetical protein